MSNTLLYDQFTEGYGISSWQQLEELNKALSAGTTDYLGAPGTLTQGGALQIESLDSSLKATTWQMKQLRLWPAIPKGRAYQTVEQYNRLTSYGQQSGGAFFDADAAVAPSAHDSNYNRQTQVVRYMGTTRVVSHPLTLVRTNYGDVVAAEIDRGNMYILQNLEEQLFVGNGFYQSAVGIFDGDPADVPANSPKFNGLEQQIRVGLSDVKAQYTGWDGKGGVIAVTTDLADAIIDEDSLEEGARRVADNHGYPTDLFMSNKVHSDLSKTFFPKERIFNMGVSSGQAGFVLRTFMSSAGEFGLKGSTFLRQKRGVLLAAEQDGPGAVVITSVTTAADTAAFTTATQGTYSYRVAAMNANGEGLAVAESNAAVTAGNRLVVIIAAGTVGAQAYAVYRAPVGTTVGHEFIGLVADITGNGGGAVFADADNKVPGRSTAYLMQVDSDNLVWKQLAPLMKMNLATIGTGIRWMQLLYGTPILFGPLHHHLYENIGEN